MSGKSYAKIFIKATLAQLVEHLTRNEKVRSSILRCGSRFDIIKYMKKAIIFDLDGTLFNNLNVYKDAHKEMFSKRGLEYKILPHDKGSKTIELMQTFADHFKNEKGEEISAEDLLKEQDELVFNEYENKVEMTKGVKEFLDFLNENKIRKAVATTARNKTIKILFRKVFSIFN